MALEAGAGGLRDVAVGASREEAADAFGEYFDDAFFTSYDEFDAEIDLSLLRSLGLVAGDGLTAVLPRVLGRDNEPGHPRPRVVVGLTPGVDRREVVERLIAAHPPVTFTQVIECGDSVLVPLEPVGDSMPGERDSLLDKLQAARPPLTSSGSAQRAPEDPSRSSPSETAARTPAGSVAPAGIRSRLPSRRRLVVMAAVGAFLALVLLTLVGLVAGAHGVLLVVIVFLAGSQCAMLLGLFYLVRRVRELGEDRDEQAAFREQMRRRTDRLVRVSKNSVRLQRENMAAVKKARTEVGNRVMAVGKFLSRAGAASRETQPPE